jgi:hypothetical protein
MTQLLTKENHRHDFTKKRLNEIAKTIGIKIILLYPKNILPRTLDKIIDTMTIMFDVLNIDANRTTKSFCPIPMVKIYVNLEMDFFVFLDMGY